MEFVCQGIIKDSKKLLGSLESHSEEQSDSSQFNSKPEIKISELTSDNNPKSENFEVAKPDLKPKLEKGFSAPCNRKTDNNVFPTCRRSITDLPPALISEVLNFLGPKELGIVSCASTILCRLVSDHRVWKEFYCSRWGLALLDSEHYNEKSWKEIFVEREFRSRIFMGRYSIDVLYGHTEAVRTVFLLASAKLIFTSGYDSVVRMWDMEEGLSVSSSQPLGCTIRAVAADTKLLVAAGTDGFIHCWRAVEGLPHLFDIRGSQCQNIEFRIWGHEGPVTSLALDLTMIYSGSWDMTVRLWDRSTLKCLKVLKHSDWVWGLVPHDSTIASTSGSDVYLWDTSNGNLMTIIHNAHAGNTYSLARSHTGDFLFTGGEDGAVCMFQISRKYHETHALKVATWIPHSGPVYSLGFEFPWLVSASSDGKLSLIDVRKLLRTGKIGIGKIGLNAKQVDKSNVEPPQRMLHGFGSNLFSVDIGADRIVCGGEEGVVRIWNFSQALEIEQRVRAIKGIRLEHRMRRRKLQAEVSGKGGRKDGCSVAAKKIDSDKRGIWPKKTGTNGKLKA